MTIPVPSTIGMVPLPIMSPLRPRQGQVLPTRRHPCLQSQRPIPPTQITRTPSGAIRVRQPAEQQERERRRNGQRLSPSNSSRLPQRRKRTWHEPTHQRRPRAVSPRQTFHRHPSCRGTLTNSSSTCAPLWLGLRSAVRRRRAVNETSGAAGARRSGRDANGTGLAMETVALVPRISA